MSTLMDNIVLVIHIILPLFTVGTSRVSALYYPLLCLMMGVKEDFFFFEPLFPCNLAFVVTTGYFNNLSVLNWLTCGYGSRDGCLTPNITVTGKDHRGGKGSSRREGGE